MIFSEGDSSKKGRDLKVETEKNIEKFLSLETVLSTLSSRFLGNTDIDEAINDSLCDIATLSGANRAYVFLFNNNKSIMKRTNKWCTEGSNTQFKKMKNLNSNFKLGNGKYFIIEGDEYDSAFFEKIPKFIIYRPHHLILTSLEFDHADIYSSIDEIKLWFRRLVNIIPSKGNIVYSSDYANIKEVISNALSKCNTYGKEQSDFTYKFLNYSGTLSNFIIRLTIP